MVTPELKEYIATQLAAGTSRETLQATLATQGWDAQDIAEVLPAPEAVRAAQANSRSYAIPIVVAVLVLLFGGGGAFLYIETQKHNALASATPVPTVFVEKTATPVATATATPSPSASATTTGTLTASDATWNTYTNTTLGFSMKIPKTSTIDDCKKNDSDGTYNLGTYGAAPVGVFEETSDVYIAAATYALLAGPNTLAGKTEYSSCTDTATTLQAVSTVTNTSNYFIPHWKIKVATVKNDTELDAFIKTVYGKTCRLGAETAASQDGVFNVAVTGDGKPLDTTECPLNFLTVIKYNPTKAKVFAWDMGQGITFYTSAAAGSSTPTNYDMDMRDSFNFL